MDPQIFRFFFSQKSSKNSNYYCFWPKIPLGSHREPPKSHPRASQEPSKRPQETHKSLLEVPMCPPRQFRKGRLFDVHVSNDDVIGMYCPQGLTGFPNRTGRVACGTQGPSIDQGVGAILFFDSASTKLFFEGVHRNLSLNTWIFHCIISAMWGIRLCLRSGWPAGYVVIRPQCMPMKKIYNITSAWQQVIAILFCRRTWQFESALFSMLQY